jgi:hypothetical protein
MLDMLKTTSKNPILTGCFMWDRSSMPMPRKINNQSTIISGR